MTNCFLMSRGGSVNVEGINRPRVCHLKSYSLFPDDLIVKRFSFSFTRFEQLFRLISADENWFLLERRLETRLLQLLRLFLNAPIIIILKPTYFLLFLVARSEWKILFSYPPQKHISALNLSSLQALARYWSGTILQLFLNSWTAARRVSLES